MCEEQSIVTQCCDSYINIHYFFNLPLDLKPEIQFGNFRRRAEIERKYIHSLHVGLLKKDNKMFSFYLVFAAAV